MSFVFADYPQTIHATSNPQHLKAFQQRRINGMGLSRRVWNLRTQYKRELELGLSVGIERGTSANALARELKQYLNNPDKLFRRVRDKFGRLQLSKNAKAYHPGRGVYRSSFKNAQRLTRSEINMSYRTAEQARWRQFDFVVGYEIKLSYSHPCEDICDKLAGKYPKSFVWTGWHPNDLCYEVPILKTEDEFFSLDDDKPSVNEVTDVPQGFKDWVAENKDRMAAAEERGTQPYFIRDNKEVVDGILNENVQTKTASQAAKEHSAAYASHIHGKSEDKAVNGEVVKGYVTEKVTLDVINMRKDALSSDRFRLSQEHIYVPNLISKKIKFAKKPLQRIINHCISEEEINAVEYLWKNPNILINPRISPLGENKDLSLKKNIKNIEGKKKRGIEEYVEYEFTFHNTTWLVKLEHHKAGFEQPYHIRKK